MAAAEDLVKLLNTTKNPFDLSHHMQDIVAGLADIVARLNELESQIAAMKRPKP